MAVTQVGLTGPQHVYLGFLAKGETVVVPPDPTVSPDPSVIVTVRAAPVSITDNGTVPHDPAAVEVYQVGWGDRLASGVTILTSTFAIEAVDPTSTPTLVALDTSPLGIQVGGRTTKVRLSTPTLRALYRVSNTITTSDEQTLQRSFYLLGEDE